MYTIKKRVAKKISLATKLQQRTNIKIRINSYSNRWIKWALGGVIV